MDSKENSSITSCWRQRVSEEINNLMIDYQYLDNKPETVDNLIVRNRNSSNDVFAIVGLRLTDRGNKATIKRGTNEKFPKRELRSYNKDFIAKVYKQYLKKYLIPEDRFKHSFNDQMAADMDKWIADQYPKCSSIVREYLKSIGLTIKDAKGNTQPTTPHYGYITSKVISPVCNAVLLPSLVRKSAWKAQIPEKYDFVKDERGFLKEK
jgi:hypothetical protein